MYGLNYKERVNK